MLLSLGGASRIKKSTHNRGIFPKNTFADTYRDTLMYEVEYQRKINTMYINRLLLLIFFSQWFYFNNFNCSFARCRFCALTFCDLYPAEVSTDISVPTYQKTISITFLSISRDETKIFEHSCLLFSSFGLIELRVKLPLVK